MAKPKIIFFGTPEFGRIVLAKLLEEKALVAGVVTAPDRPRGRGQKPTSSPVKTLAKESKLAVLTPADKKELLAVRRKLLALKPDLFVIAAYGLIIPGEILAIPKKGTLNVHPSLLPKYRGPSPISAAILAGDQETGVTIMFTDEEMDHGPLLTQAKIPIEPTETTGTLTLKLAQLGGQLLVKTIPAYLTGEIKPVEQDHTLATYTRLLTREDGRVQWGKSNYEIERMVRALNPWPGVWTTVGELAAELDRELKNPKHENLKLKILEAAAENGALAIKTIQVEGRDPIPFTEFANGYLS